MSFKDIVLKNCLHELTVCQHLYTKLDPDKQNWRPRDNMRSTLELMQYISSIGSSLAKHYITNPPKEGARERYSASRASTANMRFEEFPAVLDVQKEQLQQLFHELTDDDLLHKVTYNPFNGMDLGLFEGLEFTLKVLCAYRHELFIHAKMCGADIYTSNNWGGRDTPQPAAAPASAAAATAA